MNKPFNAGITRFFEDHAPKDIQDVIQNAAKNDILEPSFPYSKRMSRKEYEAQLAGLQIELAKMQSWAIESGARVAIIFEGRDAAGKGGTIKRFCEHLNPRNARIVALSKPSHKESGEWYFQRYIKHLPTAGGMTFFDRSWYNRGVVEHVFGFCSASEREGFFNQVNDVENMVTSDGTHLFKLWLNVGRAEQLRRFLAREADPLKQWKLSKIDVDGLFKWDEYTAAIHETLTRSHSETAPWSIIKTDDKRRARLNAMRRVLHVLDYTDKNLDAIGEIDRGICGDPKEFNV